MYIADLHIHSRYSRATSRDCTPEHLDLWARRKGIGLLGTGDFTHPAWRQELAEKLTPTGDGLLTLKDGYRLAEFDTGAAAPRFVISGEISSIYKKNGKVRKVHSVILLPGLEEAELLSRKLETIGNIHSDGRPILGLDCHDLLEITLELCPNAIFIPAHIWTPHFSLFGAFSGFDTIEECFEDLTPYIHALETGLSSDPAMNRRWSALDRFQLVSNSDAHSPAKLGREANLLDAEVSYDGLIAAIQRGEGLKGTVEFFPEEGKYHYDGHRKCHLCLSPREAEACGNICPLCGRKLTTGVSHRIEQLADREEGFQLAGDKPFESLVPLPEVIAASLGVSAASVRVRRQYDEILAKLGPEFPILRELPIEEIRRGVGPLVAEGIRRLREGRVAWNPGYDGEYGTVKLFDRLEIDTILGEGSLFSGEDLAGTKREQKKQKPAAALPANPVQEETAAVPAFSLNEAQQEAVTTMARVIAVIAGPGTGKTKTLVARILHLLEERKVKTTEITAVTFTNRAAAELRTRLEDAAGKRALGRIKIGTFHSLCYQFLKDHGLAFTLADEGRLKEVAQEVIQESGFDLNPKAFLRWVSLRKRNSVQGDAGLPKREQVAPREACYEAYQQRLREKELIDFDGLLLETLRLLKTEQKRELRKKHYDYLLVDEFQDISPIQYELIEAWNRGGRELFVIGDPDQAIYAFRGADAQCFQRLAAAEPGLCTIRLKENYRSRLPIIAGALAVIARNPGPSRELAAVRGQGSPIRLVRTGGAMAEAVFAAKEINRLVGGIDMVDSDIQGPRSREHQVRGFGEIAVLYRTHRQAELLEKCLRQEGIPYVVAGRESFLTESVVVGSLCFFRYLLNPEDREALKLCLKLVWNQPENPVSEAALTALVKQYQPKAAKEKPQKLLLGWGADLNLGNNEALEKLANTALFYKTMPEMLDALALGGEGDLKRCGGRSYQAEAVTLMTLHAAKGLEFPVVMICGVREGMIPLENQGQVDDIEEERRLFYVGMTRAKEELILATSPAPSPFLADLPEEGILRENAGKEKSGGSEKQMSFFDFEM